MVHPEPLGHQPVLRLHHVGIGVAREAGPQAVARFAGLPVADPVRENEVVPVGIQQLARPEEHAPEGRV